MKFNLPTETPPEPERTEVRIGDVFNVKGRGPARFWLIVAIRDRMCVALGLDAEGVIVSGTTYGTHVFENDQRLGIRRIKLGRVEGLDELSFDVRWEQEP